MVRIKRQLVPDLATSVRRCRESLVILKSARRERLLRARVGVRSFHFQCSAHARIQHLVSITMSRIFIFVRSFDLFSRFPDSSIANHYGRSLVLVNKRDAVPTDRYVSFYCTYLSQLRDVTPRQTIFFLISDIVFVLILTFVVSHDELQKQKNNTNKKVYIFVVYFIC